MDEKIEKIISLVGNENRYQYFTLIIIVFLWINCNFIAIVLPFIEREPIINYIDSKGEKHFNVTLTNEICSETGGIYEVVESFDYSWVQEYGIECNNVDIGLISMFAFIGNTAGGFVFSFITKFLAHKTILIVSSFGFCLGVFLCTIVTSYTYFYFLLFCEILIGMFGNCLCYSSLVVAQEIVSNKKRSIFSSIINIGYSLCGIIYSLVFLIAQDWRTVFYVLIGGSIISLVMIWIFVYDSPRAFMDKKDMRTTMHILEGIAKFNGKLESFRESIKEDDNKKILDEISGEEKKDEDNNGEENDKEEEENKDKNEPLVEDQGKKKPKVKINVWSLFKYRSIRYKFIILNILWVGTRASFNGISISSKSFPGNFYINIIVLFIMESISYIVAGVLIEVKKLGRRGALWIQYCILILSFILLAFLELDTAPLLVLNFIARFCAAGIEVIYYTYSIEIYPTPVRGVAFGVNAMMGNGGSIVISMVLEFLANWVFLTIFACVCGLNSALLYFLPETVGKPMIESIEELEVEENEEEDEVIYDDKEKNKNKKVKGKKKEDEEDKEEKKDEEDKEEKKDEEDKKDKDDKEEKKDEEEKGDKEDKDDNDE
jgi:MFS family permease